MSAPERLHVWRGLFGEFHASEEQYGGAPEYIRADLYEQAVRERDGARASFLRCLIAMNVEPSPPTAADIAWAKSVFDEQESAMQALVDQSQALGLYDEGKK